MFAKFMALPYIARRALIAVALFFLLCISLHLPQNAFSEALCFTSLFGWLWAIGILIPFLKVMLFVLRGVLNYHVLFK